VLDPGARLTHVEMTADLALVVPMQFPSEKGRTVRRLDRVDQGFEQQRVKGLQVLGILEHQVGRIFDLPEAPRIRDIELLNHWALPLGKSVQVGV
jgi:hypothetical protein